MRGVKTGDHACKGPECGRRVKVKGRHCESCQRQLNEVSKAAQAILFPPAQPYMPRVVTVAHTERR